MMLDVTKYRYESLDFGSVFPLTPLQQAQKEAEYAKELAEQIAAETPPVPTFSEAELEAAKKLAFEEGRKAGVDEMQKMHAEIQAQEAVRLEELLLKIDAQIAGCAKIAHNEREHIAEQLKAIAFAAAKKVINNMPDAQLRQIENFIEGALGVVSEGQKVTLRLHSSVEKQLAGQLMGKFEQLNVAVDDSILPNDLKITWNNGYSERKLDELWKEIGQIVVGKFDIDEFAQKPAINETKNEIGNE